MSPRDTRQRLQNILIVLLVLVIVAAAYVLMTNPIGESVDILSPEEIIESTDEYLGKVVTVEGFYYHGNYLEGEGYITSSIVEPLSSSTEFLQRLSVNHSGVNISLADQVKYRFTGLLTLDESVPIPSSNAVILVADEIIRV